MQTILGQEKLYAIKSKHPVLQVYHFCDSFRATHAVACVLPFEILARCDFFTSILSFGATLLAMSALSHKVGITSTQRLPPISKGHVRGYILSTCGNKQHYMFRLCLMHREFARGNGILIKGCMTNNGNCSRARWRHHDIAYCSRVVHNLSLYGTIHRKCFSD